MIGARRVEIVLDKKDLRVLFISIHLVQAFGVIIIREVRPFVLFYFLLVQQARN